jgi:hypothetical protein
LTEEKIKETVNKIGEEQGCVIFSTYLDNGKDAVTKIMGTDEQIAQMVASILYETSDVFALVKKYMERKRLQDTKRARLVH